MRIERAPGPAGPPGPAAAESAAKAPDRAASTARARPGAVAAETVFTHARPSADLGGGGQGPAFRADSSTRLLRGRPVERASLLAPTLSAASPETRGVELARIHGQRTLRRVRGTLGPIANSLSTTLAPVERGKLAPPPALDLSSTQAASLNGAIELAADASRIEGLGAESLSASMVDRLLGQLEFLSLGGPADAEALEMRSAAQRAIAALAP
jgi:hypothetical protein